MARRQEICTVLLDVGQLMADVVDYAAKAVSAFVISKMLNKPAHELALVYFGTTGTSNPLNTELSEDGDDQYQHITQMQELRQPNLDYLQDLSSLKPGTGHSDFVDALTVAVDGMFKVISARPDLERANVVKRIVLISNFLSRAKDDPDDVFIPVLIQRMHEKGVQLDVMSLDVPSQDAAHLASKRFNINLLTRILSEVNHTLKKVMHPLDLLGAFKAKEYSHVAYFTGPLEIGPMNIKVKVSKKVAREKPPSLAMYSDRGTADEGATHTVARSTEHKAMAVDDIPGDPLDKSQRIKSYRYGKQTVPISPEDEQLLQYHAEKGMKLMGFVDSASIPHYAFMKDPWGVVPEKGNAAACTAMSALVRAMARSNTVALIRFVPRAHGSIVIGCAQPLLGSINKPDYLILNHLPYQEDVRTLPFPSFNDEKRKPSHDQLLLAQEVVHNLDLTSDGAERLQPEGTVNPVLHRLLAFMGARALDPSAVVPKSDPLVERILDPLAPEAGSDVAALLARLPTVFQTSLEHTDAEPAAAAAQEEQPAMMQDSEADAGGEAALAPTQQAPKVHSVGQDTPVEDFQAMIRQGQLQEAVDGLKQAVQMMVDNSLGTRYYSKALQCVLALRAACVTHGRGKDFNKFLADLASRYESSAIRGAWWHQVVDSGLGLVTADESSDVEITAADAQHFIRQHSPWFQVKDEKPSTAPMAVDDDFEEME